MDDVATETEVQHCTECNDVNTMRLHEWKDNKLTLRDLIVSW